MDKKNSLRVKLTGPSTIQCPHCQDRETGGKTTAFKRLLDLGLEIYIDWTDHEDTDESYVGIIFFTDGASRLVTPYFISTLGNEKENLAALKHYVEYL